MGHAHGHGITPLAGSHPAEQGSDGQPASWRYRGRLVTALALLGALAVVEVVVGVRSRSLALLSDAGHVAVDVLALGMTLAAMTAAARAGRTGHRTFGLYRLEVVVTLVNAVLLAAVAGWVLVEAVSRLRDPVPVAGVPLTLAAGAALVVNAVGYALLRPGGREALSLRGASLEVLVDGIAAAGALGAGLIVWLTGWRYADPLVALAVAVLILPRAAGLARSALRVLLEAAPHHLDVPAVAADLAALPGVLEVHDLHVWTVTSGMEAATVHLTIEAGAEPAGLLGAARRVLVGHGVPHATVQLEPAGTTGCCHNASW